MPVINTSGFQVAERPRVDYMDPRQLVPAYGQIVPAASQGLGLYGQFQQIADEAQTRPTRQQLLQIQLQDAQNRLAQAPLEQQLRMAQIAEAQQNAARPVQITDDISITGGTPMLPEITNPGASFEDLKFASPGYLPQIETITGRDILAGGKVVPTTRTKTLKTGAEAKMIADKFALDERRADDLANYRQDLGAAALQRARAAQDKIARGTKIGQGVNPSTGTLVVTIRNPDGTIEQVDTLTEPIAPVPAQVQLIREFMGGGNGAPRSPAAPQFSYRSADEVKAAFNSGLLPEAEAVKILREQFGFTQ